MFRRIGMHAGAFLCVLMTMIANAVEIHVPQDYLTIQEAVNTAQDGDSILVAPGEYEGFHSINSPNNITLIGSGAFCDYPTVITSIITSDSSACIILVNVYGLSISKIEIKETFQSNPPCWGGFWIENSEDIYVEEVYVSQTSGPGAGAVGLWTSTNVEFKKSLFCSGYYDVITIRNGTNYYFRNLTVAEGETANGIVVRDVIYGELVIENCISAFNSGDGFEFAYNSWRPYYTVEYNCSFGNGGGGNWTGFTPSPTNITLDPLFLGGTGWENPVTTPIVDTALPETFDVSAFPNPFNPTTIISFELPVASMVKLEVFDIAGRAVGGGSTPALQLVNGWREAGSHEVTFDGSGLASGVYIYRLQAGEFTGYGKMILLK